MHRPPPSIPLPLLPRLLLLVLLTALPTAAPAPAHGQAPAPQEETGATPDLPPIQEEELHRFARVYLEVVQVRDGLRGDLEQAADEAEARRLREEARLRMRALVEGSGLTVERFSQIGHILDGDAEQRAGFQAVVARIRAGEGRGRPLR